MKKIKIKPINGILESNLKGANQSVQSMFEQFKVKVDLYTGEVIFTNTFLNFSYLKSLKIVFEEKNYEYELTSLGGKVFVKDYQNLEPFNKIHLLKQLQNELKTPSVHIPSKMKL